MSNLILPALKYDYELHILFCKCTLCGVYLVMMKKFEYSVLETKQDTQDVSKVKTKLE